MQDGIIKGTGNSRYLKSVQNFLNLYPTYQDFASALADGTLPIDFNGINAAGWNQIGTALNKANLLSDATASLLGLTNAATPDNGLEALANRAIAGIEVVYGSYTGSGTSADNATKTIITDKTPLLVVIDSNAERCSLCVKTKTRSTSIMANASGDQVESNVTYVTVENGFIVSLYDYYDSYNGVTAHDGTNANGQVYNYIAFCIAGAF